MCVHKRIVFGDGILTHDTIVSVQSQHRSICVVEPYVMFVMSGLLAVHMCDYEHSIIRDKDPNPVSVGQNGADMAVFRIFSFIRTPAMIALLAYLYHAKPFQAYAPAPWCL